MSRLPPRDTMYRALIERDPAFEGVFIVAVKTTGVFCRSVCSARKPRPENCEYFADVHAARRAGYRACLRCKPEQPLAAPPPDVARLAQAAERSTRRLRDADVRALGLSPSTARRLFHRHYGMTFHAYQRARRMGRALDDMQQGATVTTAATASGYDSLSGFGSAFASVFGEAPTRAARAGSPLLADWMHTPLGPMVAVAVGDRLALLEFHDRRALEAELAWLRRFHDAPIVPGRSPVLEQIAAEVAAYFAGTLARFETPIALDGTPWQRAAWSELLTIPPGRTRSYGEMARRLGKPGAARAVGKANGENRLGIIVPCHRVIREDGTLCGYGGGIWRKQWLLDHEAAAAGLFTPAPPAAAPAAAPVTVTTA